jgi:hypothetical protein
MNKVKKDYCSKNLHPKWRAWVAKYDMSSVEWKLTGCYCIFCNKDLGINNVIGSGAPKENQYIKKYVPSCLSGIQQLKLLHHYNKSL